MTAGPQHVVFTLTVTMLSDWHIGTGGGRHGAIDRLIERDADDLPFVPATTLRGIWRDAAETLALGLDDGADTGPWSTVLERVFGDQPALARAPSGERPQSGALMLGAARLPAYLRDALWQSGTDGSDTDPGRRRLRQALTFVKPGVAIAPESGRAKPDYLRFEEVARQGAVLTAEGILTLPQDEDLAKAAMALLVGAAALVDRLGGKRRRGTGRCAWSMAFGKATPETPPPVTDLAQAITVLGSAPPVFGSADLPGDQSAQAYTDPQAHSDWETATLELTLKSPLVVADAVLGNVVTSYTFIPGTYLLPHIARALKTSDFDASPHIMAGDIRVGHARPVLGGCRSLPIPLAWEQVKDDRSDRKLTGRLFNRATERHPEECQLTSLPQGYVALSAAGGSPTILTRVGTVVRTHNTVDDKVQRPTEDVGGVYSYEAIAAGTQFRTVVQIRKSLCSRLGDWRGRLSEGNLRLGRARKAGYGEVTFKLVGDAPPADSTPLPDPGQATIFFASDVLLRTPLLGTGTDQEQVVAAISDALGWKVTVPDAAPPIATEGTEEKCTSAKSRLILCRLRARRIDSWAAAWHLPRPSLIAIQAGSYIVVKSADNTPIPEQALARLHSEGLGERRAEGYGEILVNPKLLTVKTSSWSTPPEDKSDKGNAQRRDGTMAASLKGAAMTEAERAFVQQIEQAAWLAAIEEAAFTFAAAPERRHDKLRWKASGQGTPPMSQLGALRSAMGQFADDTDVAATLRWLGQVKKNDSRSGKWGEALNALERLLSDSASVWTLLDESRSPWPGTLLTDDPSDLKKRHWHDAVRAVLLASIRAHKRALEEERSHDEWKAA
ncbi:MAG: hypothetical protein H6843_06810 [Rhodospirillaceae bacterium]|nr:hypothetical protein [Rhodospirillaceae bacterium]